MHEIQLNSLKIGCRNQGGSDILTDFTERFFQSSAVELASVTNEDIKRSVTCIEPSFADILQFL